LLNYSAQSECDEHLVQVQTAQQRQQTEGLKSELGNESAEHKSTRKEMEAMKVPLQLQVNA
jgi:hypothetical protein